MALNLKQMGMRKMKKTNNYTFERADYPKEKIYLLDINRRMTNAWHKYFDGQPNIEIVNGSFRRFMNKHPEIDGIVSPANSFGLMDEGYNKAIINYLGEKAQVNVLTVVGAVYHGYQPIGTCLGIPYGKYTILHTPTMRGPEKILDIRVVYDCMYSCLLETKRQSLNNVVIPAFGGLTGKVPYDDIARLMFLAYTHIYNERYEPGWGHVRRIMNAINE